MQDTTKALHYSIRFPVVGKYLGLLSAMLAVLTLVPLLVSVWFGEYAFSWRYLSIIVVLIAICVPTLRQDYPEDIQTNESLVITALVFVISPFLLSYPLMAGGLNYLDSWFETVSAITTTGLTTITDVSSLPKTFLFSRAWMQWFGGLGIIVLSLAILIDHNMALWRLVEKGGETLLTTTRTYARNMLITYFSITFIGFLILWTVLGESFLALNHTLSAVSTGGFSTLNNSIADIDNWTARTFVILLGMSGAIPFFLYFRLTHGNWRSVIMDVELRALMLVVLLICAALTFSLSFSFGLSWDDALSHGVLLGISAQTTTGFSTLNVGELDNFSMVLLMFAMFIGGGIGSTAGGIKILRLLILARLLLILIQRTAMPRHAVLEPRLGDRRLSEDDIQRALLLVILYVVVIAFSWIIFIAYGYDPLDALFEVTSATGTVGLSSGVTSATLDPMLKIVLGLDMLFGRLEIFALLIVLYPGTWFGKRVE